MGSTDWRLRKRTRITCLNLVVVVLDAYIHNVYIHSASHAPQLLATSL